MIMTNSIKISGLCKSYGDFALDHIDLKLPGGSIMGLIGENGAGKTTTIKCILNLIRRDAGTITLMGYDNIAQEQQAKAEVGVVLDECYFHDTLRPTDIHTILSRVYENWDKALFASCLKKFQLPECKYVKEFSRGMKMKLSLAAALAHHPKLLILDEATAGLDPVVRDEILDEFLNFIQDEEHSILISSHITSDLEKVADYITFLHQGKLVFTLEKDLLVDQYGVLHCGAAVFDTLDPADILAWRREAYQYKVLVRDRYQAEKKYPQALVSPAAIEDTMLFYVKGEVS